MIEIFDNMTEISLEAVSSLLDKVPAWRKEEALKFKHLFGQFAALKSYCMLRQLVGSADKAADWEYGANGKPFLKQLKGTYFNISHCKSGIAVAVEKEPVGIDIETIKQPSDGLIGKVMNAEEFDFINNSDNPSLAFTHLWTQKEAVCKLTGTGITDFLQNTLSPDFYDLHTVENLEKGYVYTIAKYKNWKKLNYDSINAGAEKIVQEVLTALGTDNNNICLALEEAVVNILSYAYSSDGSLSVETAHGDRNFMVTLCDKGEPFNPLEQEEAELSDDIETRKIGGLGIMLIKQMTASLRYERSFGENRLTLVF